MDASGDGDPIISVIAGSYVLFCSQGVSLPCLNSVGPFLNTAAAFAPCDSCNVSEGIALSSTGVCYLAPCGNPPPVPPCLTNMCPGFVDQGGTLPHDLTLNLLAGSIVGTLNPDTDSSSGSCSGDTYTYSQTTISWPAQTIDMSAEGEGNPCEWVQSVSESVNVTRKFYSDAEGDDLVCSETDVAFPSWTICLNNTTGLWEIDNGLFGQFPGEPVGTTGCVGSTWATLCNLNAPTGTYTDGSTVTTTDGEKIKSKPVAPDHMKITPKKDCGCSRAKRAA